MNFKKITSETLLLSFVVLLFSSIVLYIMPSGYYPGEKKWYMLFLSKGVWKDLHITIGFIFFIFLFVHIAYNIKLIIKYTINKRPFFLSPEFAAAVLLITAACIGTGYNIKPFKTILELRYSLNHSYSKKKDYPESKESYLNKQSCEDKTFLSLKKNSIKNYQSMDKILSQKLSISENTFTKNSFSFSDEDLISSPREL